MASPISTPLFENRTRLVLTLSILLVPVASGALAEEHRPGKAPDDDRRLNVLFIAVDDLNDWVGCLGGHPQARTPHLDRLAERSVLFSNAHCQAPICNPSRAGRGWRCRSYLPTARC